MRLPTTFSKNESANQRSMQALGPVTRSLLRLISVLFLISFVTISADPTQASNSKLRRYPYLTDVVGSYATINWATDNSSKIGTATWGQADSESCTAHSAPATYTSVNVNNVTTYHWKAMLSLSPNTRYCYRVFLNGTDLLDSDPSPVFWTQIPAGATDSYSFAVFGDWGLVDSTGANPNQANLMKQIAQSGARFAFTVGDNGYPSGNQANYGDLFQTGDGLSAIFGPKFWTVAGSSIPLFPAIGNHGISSSSTSHPHLLHWPQDRAAANSNGKYIKEIYCCLNGTTSAVYPSAWYAFDVGQTRFYVLEAAWADTNVGTAVGAGYEMDYDYHWTPTSLEYQWLAADLANHTSTPLKFAFWHYPLYSDNKHETSNTFLQGQNSLEGLLSQYGVQLAFNGHVHTYQRNNPSSTGLLTYDTGGGGATLESPEACSAIDAYGLGWSTSKNQVKKCGAAVASSTATSIDNIFHFLLVSVNGTQVTVTPTDSLGNTFDIQTYNFSTASPVLPASASSTIAPDATPPSAPTNLVATVAGPHELDLTWSAAKDNLGVTMYNIRRNGAVLATVSGSSLSYADIGVDDQTTYQYTVEAVDEAGNVSAVSNAATATTPVAPLGTPTNLIAAIVNAYRIDLTWEASIDRTNLASYLIRRNGVALATVSSDVLRYSDATGVPGKTYSYTVEAVDTAGNHSVPSDPAIPTEPDDLPPATIFLPIVQ